MIVSDAGPIIAFARANLLDLLGRVVVELGIPDAVHAELTVGGSARVEDVIQAEWIKRVSIPIGSEAEILSRRLGKGEREAIVLAQSLGLPLLADDAAARREALSRRLVVVGSLGVLREAKLLGIIEGGGSLSIASVKPGSGSLGICTSSSAAQWARPSRSERPDRGEGRGRLPTSFSTASPGLG